MQIQIYSPTQGQPLPTVQWNYPEVRQWVEDGLQAYKGVVYTEDMITQAKKDRATLNRLVTAIDTKRKEMKALYLQPYESFEKEAKELISMIKEVGGEIDAQVKAYDEYRKKEKQEKVKEMYAAMIGSLAELLPYERLHDPKWLNVTKSMSAISEEMGRIIDRVESGLSSIDTLNLDPEIAERVKGVFLQNFDLAAALAERERIEKQREELARFKAAQEAAKAAKPVEVESVPVQETKPAVESSAPVTKEEKVYTVTFRIHVTAEKLQLLGDFMKANGIRPERVKE